MKSATALDLPRPLVGRLDSLTGLRWFAAFVVFLHHVQNLGNIAVFWPFLQYGTYGVTFFFVLSGFVLTWTSSPKTGAATFYWRRFARIYPAAFVALLIAIPVFYSVYPDPAQTWVKPVDLGILLLSVPLVQAWWSAPGIKMSGNPAAWTLTCEFFFYALHPWIMRPFRRLSARGALMIAGGLFAVSISYEALRVVFPGSWLGLVPTPVVQVPAFVVGMCLAVAMRRGWRFHVPPVFTYLLTALLVVLLVYTSSSSTSGALRWFHTLTPEWFILVCALMIASVATRDAEGGRSFLRRRFWIRLGEWSFCFYLVHATFIYFTRELVGLKSDGLQTLWWWVLMLAVGLAGAAALHYGVERPAEKRLRRWWDARREAAKVAMSAGGEAA